MKILFLTSYVTINTRPEFSRNKTGFGYMVSDIAKAIGKLEQVDVLATDTRGGQFKYYGVNFLKRSFVLYIGCLFSCLSLSKLLSLRKNYAMSQGAFVRLVYYWLMTGYVKNVVKQGGYDIVHIHGCSFATELWMQVCKKCNQKFVVTLHGLNSFSDTVRLEPAGKKYERDFLKRVIDEKIPVTVISSGMKRIIEKTYNIADCSNISVVYNSFIFEDENGSGIDIRKRYGIPQSAKILLYVGNISYNKNQAQMARAYGLLSEEKQKNIYVLFCGAGHVKEGEIENVISNTPNSEHLILCGGVDKTEMPDYYRQADGVVLLSYAEGFGLSLIEGMHFGLPCVMPKDLDAYEDIYDDCAVVTVNERCDSTVAEAVENLLIIHWDQEAIKNYSKKFESEVMASKYKQVYHTIIGR